MQHAHHSIDSIILDIKLRCHYTDSLYGHMYLWGNAILLKKNQQPHWLIWLSTSKLHFLPYNCKLTIWTETKLTHQAITCVDPENIFPVSQGEIGRLGGVGSKVNFPENNHVNLINLEFFLFFLLGGGGGMDCPWHSPRSPHV